jgi:hypothetical protein
MASERKTGLGALPAGLLRPTTPLETIPSEPASSLEEPADQVEEQGGSTGSKPSSKTRRKRPVVASKTTGRKLVLPDDVHDRLWLLARQRRQSVSAVATEILDRNLPRFQVTREG